LQYEVGITFIVAATSEFARIHHIFVREANNYLILMVLTFLQNIMMQSICFHLMILFRSLRKFV